VLTELHAKSIDGESRRLARLYEGKVRVRCQRGEAAAVTRTVRRFAGIYTKSTKDQGSLIASDFRCNEFGAGTGNERRRETVPAALKIRRSRSRLDEQSGSSTRQRVRICTST